MPRGIPARDPRGSREKTLDRADIRRCLKSFCPDVLMYIIERGAKNISGEQK